MTHYLCNGNTWRLADERSLNLHDKLPAGNYIIKQDQFGNMFLEETDSFLNPAKLYGNCTRNADRIINTFRDRTNSTGVLLTGEKGSGKTLLAKTLSIKCAEQGIPTILINSPWCGDSFNKLIQDIDQPCVVLFDEFEKVYDKEQQESILTLLDGVFPTKKLFVLTCNDKWRIDSHMRNRPGRIFYSLDFVGLEVSFIREYCQDQLTNKEHIESLCNFATAFDQFNFDMLKAVVEEMNRYDEPPHEALQMLNAKPEFSGRARYDITLVLENQIIKADEQLDINPLNGRFAVDYVCGTDDDGDEDWTDLVVDPANLLKVDNSKGEFVYTVNTKGKDSKTGILRLTRHKATQYNYLSAL